MKKEGVCPVEARSGDMGRIQKCCCHCREKIHVAKAQLQIKLARTVQDNKKRVFSNILMAKGKLEITLAHSRMKMVTSPTGTRTQQKCSMILCLCLQHR